MLAILLVAGCSFEHGRLPGQADDDPFDDPMGIDSGTQPIARICKEKDAQLRLCLEVEDGVYDPLQDASMYQMNAPSSGVIAWDRNGTKAAAISMGDVTVPEAGSLDIPSQITMEMWMRAPFNHFGTLIANDGQYGMSLEWARIGCQIGGYRGTSAASIELDRWVHVACTFDGSTVKTYIDGAVVGCLSVQPAPMQISTQGGSGTRLFESYTGAFDDIHVYGRALAPTEICSRANKSACASSCVGLEKPEDDDG